MDLKLRMNRRYVFCYTILFAITFCAVFGWLLFGGRSLCWKEDAIAQYVPKAYYFISHGHEFFRNILSGNPSIQMYDFSIGLGDMVPLHLEPVYWLYLLTDESHIELVFTGMMIIRFYLGGLACSLLLLYFQTEEFSAILGSLIYVFSGYSMSAVLSHNQFMVPMIMLPLMIIAMEELLWKKKWQLFTGMVLISIWCGYYFTYMNTILLGIYYLVRFFCTRQERTVKDFFIKGIRITYAYTIGILIGNITFFTSFAAYMGSSRTESRKEEVGSLISYGKGWLLSFYRGFLAGPHYPGNWVRLGFIGLCYFAIALVIIKRGRVFLHLKVLFAVLTIALMIPAFGYVMSGFSNGNNRWCYAYTLIIAVITARVLPEFLTLTKKECLYLFLTMVPYELLAAKDMFIRHQGKLIFHAAVFLLFAFAVICGIQFLSDKYTFLKKAVLGALVIGLLSDLAYSFFSPSLGNEAGKYVKQGKVYESMVNTPLVASESIEDDSFYRSATYSNSSSNIGSSYVLGNNGLLYFNSTLNGNILDFCRKTGLTTFSLVKLQDFNERAMLNSLLSVKYLILDGSEKQQRAYGYKSPREQEVNGRDYKIYENEYVLPFGVTYDKIISADDLDTYDTALRQEVMMQAAAVEDPSLVNTHERIPVTGKELPFTVKEQKGAELTENSLDITKSNAKLRLSFEADPDCELYLLIKNLKFPSSSKRNITMKCNGVSSTYILRGDKETYTTSQSDYLFNLFYSEEARTSCTLTFPDKMKCTFDEICIFEQPMEKLAAYTEERKSEVLEHVEFLEDAVRGDITVSSDKLLVLNIPYQNGWKAYVDGKKADRVKTNLMFTGIYLEEGTHTIEVRYEIPGVSVSLLISLIGILMFAGLSFLQYKIRK